MPKPHLTDLPPRAADRCALCGMLRQINIGPLAAIAVVIMLPWGTPRRAAGEPLDAALTEQAYTVVEAWVRQMRVPERSLPLEIDDAAAVHVTLRFEGVALGDAVASIDNPLKPLASERAVDVMPLLADATRRAFADAEKGLRQIADRIGQGHTPRRLKDIAPLLRLEVEIARVPKRIRMTKLDELPHRFKPALHGLALRQEDRWAWVFPGTALSGNLSLQAQLQRLLHAQELGPDKIAALAGDEGLTLYRFSVTHAVRPNADGAVIALHRGSRPLPPIGLTASQIDGMCAQWSAHLRRRQDAEGRFAGTYHPTSHRYEPQFANATDCALACYALARHSRLAHTPEAQRKASAASARLGVVALLEDMAMPLTQPDEKPDEGAAPTTRVHIPTATAAVTLLALLELPNAGDLKAGRDRLGGVLITAVRADGSVRAYDHTDSANAPPSVAALTVLGLVRMYDQTRDNHYLLQAKRALDAYWRTVKPSQLNSSMPWIALCEFEMLRFKHATPGLATVRKLCDDLWALQVRPGSDTASDRIDSPDYVSPDTLGGFALNNQLLPEPTWLSAGPTVALAAALPIKGFVDDDRRVPWMINTTLALRFCAQLTMRAEDAYYAHQLTATVGGVRKAPWDNRQPLGATAMALLAACEFREALAQLK